MALGAVSVTFCLAERREFQAPDGSILKFQAAHLQDALGKCPSCGKNLEAHAVAGRQEGLRVGDVVVCIGCGTPLILEALPYEMRLMTKGEFEALDPTTRNLLQRAQGEIRKG